MNREEIINAFATLGEQMTALGKSQPIAQNPYTDLYEAIAIQINKQPHYNGWFTIENVKLAIARLGEQLTKESLENWIQPYAFSFQAKNVGIIMAGNIPLVGFHDFLCVVLSGHKVICKLSSEDKTIFPLLISLLNQIEPRLKDRIKIAMGPIKNLDAVIATGSDNSIKYFQQYFGHLPHVFRNNRTSIAIIKGNETKEDFKRLGEDIFTYFGLGCRNVSHILFPLNYNLDLFFEGIYDFHPVINHNKYGNNYDFQKTVHLMNRIPILDNNFLLLKESEELQSPLGMLHYHFYSDENDIQNYIENNKDQIQAIVGKDYIDFGSSQCPQLNDFADGINTLSWLALLN